MDGQSRLTIGMTNSADLEYLKAMKMQNPNAKIILPCRENVDIMCQFHQSDAGNSSF
jgi:hypothetical protein